MAILTMATGVELTTLVASRDDWQAAIAALQAHRDRLGIRERGDATRLIDHLEGEVARSDLAWPRMLLDGAAVDLLRAAGVEV